MSNSRIQEVDKKLKMGIIPVVTDIRYPVELQTAISRLDLEDGMIECMYQLDGVTEIVKFETEQVIEVLKKVPVIEESGFYGQRADFGLHVHVFTEEYGKGLLFIKTKRECRVPDKEIGRREREKAEQIQQEIADKIKQFKTIYDKIEAEKTSKVASNISQGTLQ